MIRAAALAAALVALPVAAWAEAAIRAGFEQPAESAGYTGDWPVWSRVRVENARTVGDGDGIFSGSAELTWHLDVDEGGFFLGDAPGVGDVNGDGRPDLVVVQHFAAEGWRVLVADLPMKDITYLTEVRFAAAVTEVVLLGVADFDGDGRQDIAVTAKLDGASKLAIYRWKDGGLDMLGPFDGFAAGPVDAGPKIRICGSKPAFLAAYADPAVVVAITPSGKPDTVDFEQVAGGVTAADFAQARACP